MLAKSFEKPVRV